MGVGVRWWAALLLAPSVGLAQDLRAQEELQGPADSARLAAGDEAVAIRAAGVIPGVDGRLDDAAWQGVPPLTGFRQTNPVEGATPSESTEVRFLYTDRDLFVAFRGFDRDPGQVVGRLTRRDQEVAADEFTVYIDSYHDRRSAFAFTVNPSGARADVFIYEDGGGRDSSWDPVYNWATRVDSLGWTAELRIPFSQLRFPPQERIVFGLRVKRLINRRNEEVNWPFVPRDQAGEVSRYGDLVGIKGVPAPRRLELLPYTGGTSRFRSGGPTDGIARAGLDAKVGITSGLTLDATINPDFGQVEADPSEVNLTDFETFFPEKRPFFVEGTNLFRVLLPGRRGEEPLVYTRRVGRAPQLTPGAGAGTVDSLFESTILGAAKLTGQLGRGWALGLLQGVTQKERVPVSTAAGLETRVPAEPLTSYSALRIQRNSQQGRLAYGGILTSVLRHLDDPVFDVLHSRALSGGADLRWRFGGDAYELTSAASASQVYGSTEAITRTQQSSARYLQRPGKTYAVIDPARTSLSG
ncbi:MAG: carbohydrate binding family 9 domain-containing protein, partial [Gemmatimonadetes bacterium]|nr:carbohydrate binding family 9 domain-containing protein [Gemmatimonadota bacterium]